MHTTVANNEIYITIDLNDDLIRIPRVTLSMLKNPDYILLLINPDSRELAIMSSDEDAQYSERINKELLKTKSSYELHSKMLIESIQQICPLLKDGCTYRIRGQYYSTFNIVAYEMNGAQCINEREER